jgi:hypothetical protein
MSDKIDWRRNHRKARSGLSINDEQELMKNHVPAKWLSQASGTSAQNTSHVEPKDSRYFPDSYPVGDKKVDTRGLS